MSKAMAEIRVQHGNEPFVVTIDVPRKDSSSKDFFCRVVSKQVGFRVNVFGVTQQQAIELSFKVAVAHISAVLTNDIAQDDVDKRRKE